MTSAALAALLAEVPAMLADAQLACELLGIETQAEEAHEYPALKMRDIRDWLVEVAIIVAPAI